jgi:hypothetical protein
MSSPGLFDDLSVHIDMSHWSVIGEPLVEGNADDVEGQISCYNNNTRTNQDAIMKEATKWILELEIMRDDIYLLAVKNAMLLDSIAMAGVCT